MLNSKFYLLLFIIFISCKIFSDPIEELLTILDQENHKTTQDELKKIKKIVDDNPDVIIKKNIGNKFGYGIVPLHAAVLSNNKSVLEYFLSKIPAKNHYIYLMGQNAENPLHIAAQKGFLDIAKLLLDARPTKWLGSRYATPDINNKDAYGDTALSLAVYNNKADLVFEILKNNNVKDLIDLNSQNKFGQTLFHIAGSKGDKAVIDLLTLLLKQIDNKVVKNIDYSLKDQNGNTLLNVFTKNYKPEYLEFIKQALINAQAKNIDIKNIKDNAGKIPADYAKEKKLKDLYKLLTGQELELKEEVKLDLDMQMKLLQDLNGTLVGLSKKYL